MNNSDDFVNPITKLHMNQCMKCGKPLVLKEEDHNTVSLSDNGVVNDLTNDDTVRYGYCESCNEKYPYVFTKGMYNAACKTNVLFQLNEIQRQKQTENKNPFGRA